MLSTLTSTAKDVPVKISSPKSVTAGEPFRISYEIGTNDIKDFKSPAFKGFHLIDSHQSSSSSITNINGKFSSQSSTTITFILEAEAEGDYIISPASMYADGNKITTRQIPIHVSASPVRSNGNNVAPGYSQSAPDNGQSVTSQTNDNKDLFVRAIVSKQKVYEQEAVLLTYKIYTRTNAYGFQGQLPVLDGFHIQEIELEPNQTQETYNGKQYMTAIWKQYVLYPQLIGKCEIPSITCEATVVTQNGFIDPFGMMPRTTTSTKRMQTPAIRIDVLPLPDSPDTFSGAVGNFKLTSSINKTKLKANDVLSVKVKISGAGNFKLMETPEFKFPDGFETYDSKVSDDIILTPKGNEGTKTFEFLAVPRESGRFVIPEMKFTYFDPSSQSYNTLSTQSYNVTVDIGDMEQKLEEAASEQNKDIRYIKTGTKNLQKNISEKLYSTKWILAYLLSIIAYLAGIGILRYHDINVFNNGSVKKNANRVAMKQLKTAKTKMDAQERDSFFDELLNTLYSYTINKFGIEKEKLNKDNIRIIFESHHVDSGIADSFINLVDDCEFARYAPSNQTKPMSDYYENAIQLISSLESCTK